MGHEQLGGDLEFVDPPWAINLFMLCFLQIVSTICYVYIESSGPVCGRIDGIYILFPSFS